MTNETRNLQSLEKTICAKLFSIKNDGNKSNNPILFSNDLQLNDQQPFFYSPLQQLFEFYHRWGSLLPPNITERERWKFLIKLKIRSKELTIVLSFQN